MLDSTVLETGTGMVLFFLLVSLLCTAVREAFETLLKSRARDLERGVRALLDDADGEEITKALLAHGQLTSLYEGQYVPQALRKNWFGVRELPFDQRSNFPSYIPANQFSAALIDLVARGTAEKPRLLQAATVSVEALRQGAWALKPGPLRQAVLAAVDNGKNDLTAVRGEIERWFDGSMDRVSGWYKRRTQIWLFLIAIAAACSFNLDSFRVAKYLANDKTLRTTVVVEAEKVVAQGLPADASAPAGKRPSTPPAGPSTATTNLASTVTLPTLGLATQTGAASTSNPASASASARDSESSKKNSPIAEVATAQKRLEEIGFPIGWTGFHPDWSPNGFFFLLWMIAGWIVTAAAASVGAPFWFDVLSKFMIVRSTIKPSQKSLEAPPVEGKAKSETEPAAAAPADPSVATPAGPATAASATSTPAAAAPTGPQLPLANDDADLPSWRDGFVNEQEISL